MPKKTHSAALRYALEQELLGNGEELYHDEDHRLAFQDRKKLYLGTVKRSERTIHYWWIRGEEEMVTIDDGPGGVFISGNLESPLMRILQKEMTAEELEDSGDYEIPPVMMKDIDKLLENGANVIGPLQYKACDVLLPLLGIRIVPENDENLIVFESVGYGVVRFYVQRR
jgi:hypothetical protein